MSSLGGQWRVLRHYLSGAALPAELARLARRLRRAEPQRWDYLLRKFEKAISIRLTQETKEIEKIKEGPGGEPPSPAAAPPAPSPSEDPQQEEKKPALSVGSEARDLTIDGLLQGLKLKKDLHFGNVPGWKDNKPTVTKSSIHCRTAYVISALEGAREAACVAKRAEDFIQHLHRYPEARDLAIKEGAVRALLRVEERLADAADAVDAADARGLLNEALALVGWCAAPRGPGPSVLALDGGGIRGLIAIELLRHLERLTGRKVNDLFDYVIGVSTGAIIAAVIGGGVGDLDTASRLYRTLSKEMFGNTSIIGGTSRLVWSHSYYDTEAWERLLQDNLGDCMLSHCNRRPNPKMALVSCVVSGGSESCLAPYLFRTYSCGYRVRGALRGTAHGKMWHAVRASAAAPTYFEEFRHDGLVHQDGGLMVNNPAGAGVHEARLLWGAAELARGTVVSLGTGRPLAAPPAARGPAARSPAAPAATSWRDKFNTILDSATDTQGVHLMLNDLLADGSYFRFNPPLMQPCAMDETDPRRLHDMMTDTRAYIRRNQHKFEEAARRLTRRRPLLQRAGDVARRRAVMMGLTYS